MTCQWGNDRLEAIDEPRVIFRDKQQITVSSGLLGKTSHDPHVAQGAADLTGTRFTLEKVPEPLHIEALCHRTRTIVDGVEHLKVLAPRLGSEPGQARAVRQGDDDTTDDAGPRRARLDCH